VGGRRHQLLSAVSASLNIMASTVLFERHPLERTVRWRILPSGMAPMDDEQALGFVLQASLSRLLQSTCPSDQASLVEKRRQAL
jgi:hypothetical protein